MVAVHHQSDGLGITKLLVFKHEIIGFFTSRVSEIIVEPNEATQIGDVSNVPVVEIMFLAVNQKYQSNGFGNMIVDEIINLGADIAERVGCRYIFLRALNDERLIAWYESRQFFRTHLELAEYDITVPMRYLIPQPYVYDWENEM